MSPKAARGIWIIKFSIMSSDVQDAGSTDQLERSSPTLARKLDVTLSQQLRKIKTQTDDRPFRKSLLLFYRTVIEGKAEPPPTQRCDPPNPTGILIWQSVGRLAIGVDSSNVVRGINRIDGRLRCSVP